MKIQILLTIILISINTYSQSSHSHIMVEIAKFEKQGKYLQIDSLYNILNSKSKLSSHELMKWAEAKFITSQEIPAAELYCKAESKRLTFLIRNSFFKNLKNSDNIEKAKKSLQTFFNCTNTEVKALSKSEWCIRTASILNFPDLEMEFIKKSYPLPNEQFSNLSSVALKHLNRGEIPEALKFSQEAYNISTESNKQKQAAALIFKSYLLLNENDSAFQWLSKAKLNRRAEIKEAIILCQKTSNFTTADTLLPLLNGNLERDTLFLRNLIFKNEIPKANKEFSTIKKRFNITNIPSLKILEARILLFSNNFPGFKSHIALLKKQSNSLNTKEKTLYLKWKTLLTILNDNETAFSIFSKISYLNYTGNYTPYNPFLNNSSLNNSIETYLLSNYLKGFIENKKYSEALPIINEINKENTSPEISYYQGIILFETGNIQSAKDILEALIIKEKGTLFSQKARIYLLNKDSE